MAVLLLRMQAVLLENALVIQLWHYREHTYFKGLSVLAATAVAYRQQLVWVHLLSCIHQLKVGALSSVVGAGMGRARLPTVDFCNERFSTCNFTSQHI